MISLTSKKQLLSEAQPGAVVVIRKYSEGIRTDISLQMAGLARKLSAKRAEIYEKGAEYRKEYAEAPDDNKPEPPAFLLELLNEQQAIERDMDHIWVNVGLVKIEGIELDGQPITAQTLISDVPEETGLYAEVKSFIKSEFGLSEDVKKNSGSPGTSGEVEQKDTQISNVGDVNASDSTGRVTVESISPAT